EGSGLGLGLHVAVEVGRANRQLVAAGQGVPGQVPLPPVVDATVRAELGLLPRVVVDAHLDLLDAALLCPGDAADDGPAGIEPVQAARGVDARLGEDRGVGGPSAVGPVGAL